MKRIELIPEWRRALHMLSVQANTINAAGLTAWASMGDLREKIPVEAAVAFAIAMLVLGTVGRLVKQSALHNGKPKEAKAPGAEGTA